MTLALRLGMTLHDLRGRMSAEELLLWMAYDRESPISDQRGDIQSSIIAASVFQAQGAKVTAVDLMPQWQVAPAEVVEEQEEMQGEAAFKTFLQMASETS